MGGPRLWSPACSTPLSPHVRGVGRRRWWWTPRRMRIGIRHLGDRTRWFPHQRRDACSCAAPTGTRSTPTSATRCRTPRSTATPAGSSRPASTTCGSRTTPTRPRSWTPATSCGLVVMNCIPGWQYFNPDPAFVALQYQNCRDLVRRDRNHPCVMLWEVSLNESPMPPEFVARTHAIAHEEYPGDQCFTAGWIHGYDVYLHARQHGGCRREEDRPCIVSEYGDWEYYAMNAGLDQGAWKNLTPAESNSRQLRWQGERALLQQATNFQEAHNDNLGIARHRRWALGDVRLQPGVRAGRGIVRLHGHLSGCRSSRTTSSAASAHRPRARWSSSPAHWTPGSATDVRVFSNCDEVELSSGRPPAGPQGARPRPPEHPARPPARSPSGLGEFRPGTLLAAGYIAGREVARHAVRTPGPIERLTIDARSRRDARWTGAARDLLFCHASLRDAQGTVVPDAWENVAFGVSGRAAVIGNNPSSSEAGIASILLATQPGPGTAVHAVAAVHAGGRVRILGASRGIEGRMLRHEIRYTTDGTEPGPAARGYRDPVGADSGLRAGLLVEGRLVASLALDTPKFRIPAGAPPEKREEFHRLTGRSSRPVLPSPSAPSSHVTRLQEHRLMRRIVRLSAAPSRRGLASRSPHPLHAQVRVASPDGRTEVTVEVRDGRLTYSLARDGRPLILPSALGFEFRGRAAAARRPPHHRHHAAVTRRVVDPAVGRGVAGARPPQRAGRRGGGDARRPAASSSSGCAPSTTASASATSCRNSRVSATSAITRRADRVRPGRQRACLVDPLQLGAQGPLGDALLLGAGERASTACRPRSRCRRRTGGPSW